MESPYDRFFDGDEVVIPNLREDLQEAQEAQESREEGEEFQVARLQELEKELKEKFPEIEEISLEFYRDDSPVWSGLQLALTLRRIEARAHFAGRENFSRYDLIEEMAQNFVEILKSERPSPHQASERWE